MPKQKEEPLYSINSPSFFVRGDAEASSSIMAALGGLQELAHQTGPVSALQSLSNTIQATYANMQSPQAQPAPADYLSMFRLCDYFIRTNGDVFQTMAIPTDVICKDMDIACADDGARTRWLEVWDGILDMNALYEEFFYETEVYGQCFPLEVWDKDVPVGVAMLEPHSMWVGYHITNSHTVSLMLPEGFGVDKLREMVHPLAYSTFVVDQNVQTGRYMRIPIDNAYLNPVFEKKMAFARYAVPNVIRASRNIMARTTLEELRLGTIEGFINQLIVATVGGKEDSPQMISAKIRRMNANLNQQKSNRTGLIVSDYTTKFDVVAPKSPDELLGVNTWTEMTNAIFRDLGFSVFFITGELPGVSARGGQQMEVNVQFAIERWKHKQRSILRWFNYLSKKIAALDGKALSSNLPQFSIGQIGVEQTTAIKERLMPLFMAGLLSAQTTLEDAGYKYDLELKNKRESNADKELFQPPTIYKQESVDGNGDSKTTSFTPQGRPPDAQNPSKLAGAVSNAMDWSAEIGDKFDASLNNDLNVFIAWMNQTLTERLSAAYTEGYARGGGNGMVDGSFMRDSKQGLTYHAQAFSNFASVLEQTPMSALPKHKQRAQSYSSATRTLYLLGYQQAKKEQGATHWQRMTHSELSDNGTCQQCEADSQVMHAIDEGYFVPHPHNVCSEQTMQFHYGNTRELGVVPDYGKPTKHKSRRTPSKST